jgi:hypothetical protein
MLNPARMATTIAVALAVFAVASPSLASAQAPTPTPIPGANVTDPLADVALGESVTLSNETTITRWANSSDLAPIRVAPTTTAPMITRLRYLTEDGLPEVYLVLEGKVDAQGEPWLHVRVPMRPNGRTGWVHADTLSQMHVVTTQMIIDRSSRRATLFRAGRKIWEAPVGIGKSRTPTPVGKFWIRERLKGDNGAYGPWAFGTSAYSNLSDWKKGGVIGIHGTNEPGLIPGTPSHGCVRVRNDKVRKLARLLPVGTPVDIVL